MRQKLISFIICSLAFIILTPVAHADFQFTPDSTSITPDIEINVQAELSLQGQANKKYFLEGAFKKADGSNYFGLTQKDGSWISYTSSNFSSLPEVTTDDQGHYQGFLKVKLDTGSSNFNGDGDYILQIKRFTEGGSSSFSDNQAQISVTGAALASPSLSPDSTSSPQASSGPSATSNPSDSKLSFTFSLAPTSVNSDQSFSVSVKIENDKSKQELYLKGAFFKDGSTNYFGKTEVNGSLVKNSASYSEQQKITTDSAGIWSGNLTVMPDDSDSGFNGSGSYKFKVAKYTASGSGPTWTDSVSVNIIEIATPAPTSKATSSPAPSITSGLGGQQVLGANAVSGSSHVLLAGAADDATIPNLESSSSATPAAILSLKKDPPTGGFYNWWLIGLGMVALGASVVPLIKSSWLSDQLRFFRGVQWKRWNL